MSLSLQRGGTPLKLRRSQFIIAAYLPKAVYVVDRCSLNRFRDFGPLSFMYKNFASSWVNISRPWTLLTSCFSHMDVSHIFVNLFSFYFLAPAAMSVLTSSQFLGLYLIAGLAGSAVQLTANLFQQRPGPSFGLGASGSISGVLTFFACAFPYQKLVVMLVLPLPAWVAVAGIVGYDMYIALRHPVSLAHDDDTAQSR